VSLATGTVNNNNNKNNSYRVRACDNEHKYLFPLESLIEAYYDCQRNKRSKNECVRFSFNREENLIRLWEDVCNGTYKPVKSKAFIITYPTKREVFAADFRDRIIHHWIALRFEPLIEGVFINDTYNCRKGRGTDYGIKRTRYLIEQISENYTKPAYIAKWDLQGYFMSIDKRILWNKVVALIDARYHAADKETLLYLMKEVIFNEPQNNCIRTSPIEMWDGLPANKSLFTNEPFFGMPIGNLTSQLLANFYVSDPDAVMKSRYIGYCRYVDDPWVISGSKTEIREAVRLFRSMIEKLGCRMHPRKFYMQEVRKGVKLIGVVIKPHRTYSAGRTVGRAIERMKEFDSLPVNKENLLKLQTSVNSYLGLMKNFATFKFRGEILRCIAPKWWRHIASVNYRTKIKITNHDYK